MTSKIFDVYSDFPFFFEDELSEICLAHEKMIFHKGDFILEEGKTANEYYNFGERSCKIFLSTILNGNDVTTHFFVEKEVVIDVSSLFQRIRLRKILSA